MVPQHTVDVAGYAGAAHVLIHPPGLDNVGDYRFARVDSLLVGVCIRVCIRVGVGVRVGIRVGVRVGVRGRAGIVVGQRPQRVQLIQPSRVGQTPLGEKPAESTGNTRLAHDAHAPNPREAASTASRSAAADANKAVRVSPDSGPATRRSTDSGVAACRCATSQVERARRTDRT